MKSTLRLLIFLFFLMGVLVQPPLFSATQDLTLGLNKEEIESLKLVLQENSYLRWKQHFDRALVLVTAPVTLPLAGLVALSIKMVDGGPSIFIQERIGRNGKHFYIYKFCTMKPSLSTTVTLTTENDPRLIRLGNFLRKTRLDELPQLWNILLGDMSFVGPRPLMAQWVQTLREQINGYDLRHLVTPGLTGRAQLEIGYTSDVPGEFAKAKADLAYIKAGPSFQGDVKYICATILRVIGGRAKGK